MWVGGGMCPHHFQRLAVLRAMELGVSNLHLNSFFISKTSGYHDIGLINSSFGKKCSQKWDENFEMLVLRKFFHKKLYFFMSNLNVECFQLSFDIHNVHVGPKLRIFKNCSTKSYKISTVKVGYFGATLRQNYATFDGVQRLCM